MVVLWIEQDHGVTKQKRLSLGINIFFLRIILINFQWTIVYLINALLFYRFCPQLSEDIAMDEKDDAKLVKILWETKVDMVKNNSKVIKLAQLLK